MGNLCRPAVTPHRQLSAEEQQMLTQMIAERRQSGGGGGSAAMPATGMNSGMGTYSGVGQPYPQQTGTMMSAAPLGVFEPAGKLQAQPKMYTTGYQGPALTQTYPASTPIPMSDNSSSSFQHSTPPVGNFVRGPSGDLYSRPIVAQTTQNQVVQSQPIAQPVYQPMTQPVIQPTEQRFVSNQTVTEEIPLARKSSSSMFPHLKVVEINLPTKSTLAPGASGDKTTTLSDDQLLTPALAEVVHSNLSTTKIDNEILQANSFNKDTTLSSRPSTLNTVVIEKQQLPLDKQSQTLQQEQTTTTTQQRPIYVAGA